MSKWGVLRHLIDNGNVDMAMRGLSESAFIKLVASAEKAEEKNVFVTCHHPRGYVEFIHSADRFICSACNTWMPVLEKTKTTVEKIWDEINKRETGVITGWDQVAMALVEAVEWFKTCQGNMAPSRSNWPDAALGEILAILKGDKKRDIPKS